MKRPTQSEDHRHYPEIQLSHYLPLELWADMVRPLNLSLNIWNLTLLCQRLVGDFLFLQANRISNSICHYWESRTSSVLPKPLVGFTKRGTLMKHYSEKERDLYSNVSGFPKVHPSPRLCPQCSILGCTSGPLLTLGST